MYIICTDDFPLKGLLLFNENFLIVLVITDFNSPPPHL